MQSDLHRERVREVPTAHSGSGTGGLTAEGRRAQDAAISARRAARAAHAAAIQALFDQDRELTLARNDA